MYQARQFNPGSHPTVQHTITKTLSCYTQRIVWLALRPREVFLRPSVAKIVLVERVKRICSSNKEFVDQVCITTFPQENFLFSLTYSSSNRFLLKPVDIILKQQKFVSLFCCYLSFFKEEPKQKQQKHIRTFKFLPLKEEFLKKKNLAHPMDQLFL